MAIEARWNEVTREMVTVDCPWCEAPVALEGADGFRCDGCSVEVQFAADETAEVALAA